MTQRAYNASKWARARFRKSTRSDGGSSGNCVEVGYVDGDVGIRDTKLGQDSPVLDVSAAAFEGLLGSIKTGYIG
jgi:NAD(P)-dependent dehydrogenase (short-subunit alcohol dehydrogenase family)